MAWVEVAARGIISSERRETERQVRPLHDICNDRGPLEPVIQPDEGHHVQKRIEERVQAQHAPQAKQPCPPVAIAAA